MNDIDACQIKSISYIGNGALSLKFNNSDKEIKATAKRLFPITRRFNFIAFFDENEKELGIMFNSHKLNKKSKRALKYALDRYYFIPKIKKIYSIKQEYGVFYWDVETDRGRRNFKVRNRSSSIKTLSENHILIIDLDQNRYEIINLNELDKSSSNLIKKYI